MAIGSLALAFAAGPPTISSISRGHSELPMSLGSFLKKQFIDVIAWTEDGPGTLQYRYPMQDMEIQNGAQLTVRECADSYHVATLDNDAAQIFAGSLDFVRAHSRASKE